MKGYRKLQSPPLYNPELLKVIKKILLALSIFLLCITWLNGWHIASFSFLVLVVYFSLWFKFGINLPQHHQELTMLWGLWAMITLCILTTGGGYDHFLLPWYGILATMASFAVKERQGLWWLAIAITTAIAIGILGHINFPSTTALTADTRKIISLINFSLELGTIAALILTYRKRLQKYQRKVAKAMTELDKEAEYRIKAEDKAIQLVAERDALLTSVGRDFLAPLDIIQQTSARLSETLSNSPKQLLSLETITRNGSRLWRLVDELLLLSLVESGDYQMQHTYLLPLLRKVVREQNGLAKPHQVEFSLQCHTELEALELTLDLEKFSLALKNCLLYSLQESSPGQILIQLTIDEAFIYISIEYQGHQLTEQQYSTLFSPHYGHTLNATKDLPISAYALLIAATIVEKHQGTIKAQAIENSILGNQIIIQLPVKPKN